MTTSDYQQLQGNFEPAKLIDEVLKIHKEISEITWILSSIPFNMETARQKIAAINRKHPENQLFFFLINPSSGNSIPCLQCFFRKFTTRFSLEKDLSGN